MKWANDFRVEGWKDVQTITMTVLAIVVIVMMLFDFIGWKTGMGAIKKHLGTGAAFSNEQQLKFNWLWFTRPFSYERYYLATDDNMNIQSYYDSNSKQDVNGYALLTLKGVGTTQLNIVNQKFSGTVKSIKGVWKISGAVYIINKGKPLYENRFVGYKKVDYPITDAIIASNIGKQPDNVQAFLKTFTHDSLHDFVMKYFEKGEAYKLFQDPKLEAAYNLDQKILAKVQYKKIYKKVLLPYRYATLGVVYNVDGRTYFRFIHKAVYIGCHGGGYIWQVGD